MLEANVDLVTSLKALYSPSQTYKKKIENCLQDIKNGDSFSDAIQSSGLFPPEYYLQVSSAEETGQIPRILKRMAESLDETINTRISQLIQLLEPAILVVMGLVTGFVVLATFLPLYSMAATTL